MYKFKILGFFEKQLNNYQKKFPHIKDDVIKCLEYFLKESASPIGTSNYKIRLISSDLKKGKNKSFRLIIHLFERRNLLIPLSVYFKSDKENISKQEIKYYLKVAMDELIKYK